MSNFQSLNWSTVGDQQLNPTLLAATPPIDLEAPATTLLPSIADRGLLRLDASMELHDARTLLERSGTHWAWVVRRETPIGLIDAHDLSSWHAAQRALQLQIQHWNEVPLDQLMSPLERLPLLTMAQLERARVGDLVETLRKSGEGFLLLLEDARLTGALSRWDIRAALGQALEPGRPAASFADIVQRVRHPNEAV